ncbi:sensor histidine kinase [Microbacterium sp. cf332]|uniref:sensor histidine kinase n=1 Tax=Microbacterium sp. cf332 TaxID=1761804 RepID=UPI0008868C06|nr:ATP-binding protein [Microbacterium sp. cf332]SDQ78993.1 Signal transduction histidine kinase [Microbacterium sp. cf332]
MPAEPPAAVTTRPRRPAEFREALAQTQRFTQSRIDRILGIVVGTGSAVIGVQALVGALSAPAGDRLWNTILLCAVLGSLLLMCVSLLTLRGVRVFSGVFAAVFPIATILWPLAAGSSTTLDEQPWLWFLVNVGTVAAVFCLPLAGQIVWAFLLPLLYGAMRLTLLEITPGTVLDVALDSIFAIILASVLIVVGWILRTLAASIDAGREGAVRSFAQAAAADAVEKERVAVAALMHDSVLAALIAAERAETDRERALAVSMAREALTRLANVDQEAGEGPDAPIPAAVVGAELEAAVHRLHPAAAVTADILPDARSVPGRVARALQLAAAQAVTNSVEHAGAANLRVSCRADAAGFDIAVRDDGPGFEAARVAEDRLGIRASIIARVAAVSGVATVDSDPSGTTVSISWRERS